MAWPKSWRQQAQQLLHVFFSHSPVHILLLTHTFGSLGSWQERRKRENVYLILYGFGSLLFVLVKEGMGHCLNSVSTSKCSLGSSYHFLFDNSGLLCFSDYCCTSLLRALHGDFYVSLLRETLKNQSTSAYQKFSLFLLMCITWWFSIIL